MYIIKSIRTITTPEGDGSYNYYDAEAKICITDEKGNNEKEAYVLAHWEASMYRFFYACTNESIYDAVVSAPDDEMEVDYIEKFDFIEDAINSEFIDLYRMLDKILTDMFRGPTKPIASQAKMLDLRTEANVTEEDGDVEEDYYFAVFQTIEYGGELYEVTFSTKTDQEGEIILKKGDTIIEQFEDLQDASGSEWFALYCKVKEKLLDFIRQYDKEHRECSLNFGWVTRDLYKDWLDLKSELWTQK